MEIKVVRMFSASFSKKKKFFIAEPFVFILKKEVLIVEHSEIREFSLQVNFKGRSSFILAVPKNWKTQGLGGLYSTFPKYQKGCRKTLLLSKPLVRR